MKKIATLILLAAINSFAAVPPLPFDHILRYDELTKLLQAWSAARPDLVKLESIGTTPQGRSIWFLTLTNEKTGPALEKPALIVDGNMHATEWGGGVAALHFAWKLVKDYGSDERVTLLLDTRTVYILPRMTPDGVDATLNQGRFIRSVDRRIRSAHCRPAFIHATWMETDEHCSCATAIRTVHGNNMRATRACSYLAPLMKREATIGACCRRESSPRTTAPRSPIRSRTILSTSARISPRTSAPRRRARPPVRIQHRNPKSLRISPQSQSVRTSSRT
jgi:hypothetical protein